MLKKRVTQDAPAEDKRKVGNVDIMLGIARTMEDIKANLGRIYVLANRSGGQQFSCCSFVSCLPLGQFCIDSWLGEQKHEEALAMFADFDDDDD